MSDELASTIIVLGTAVVLPIVLSLLSLRKKNEAEKIRKEITLAALEKNASIDIKDLIKEMNRPNKLLKEKLLQKLQWGILTSLIGLILAIAIVCMCYTGGVSTNRIWTLGIAGTCLTAVGISYCASFIVGKKMLAKEMELEEQEMQRK